MKKNTIPNFIQKAFEILQDDQNKNIITWTPSGCSFIVLDRQGLCQKVLPVYFKHSNFSSFVRQLNMYNFHKKRNNDEKLEFYHKLFRKDRKQLLIGLKRKPSQAQIMYGDQLIAKLNNGNKDNSYQGNKLSQNSSFNLQHQNQNQIKKCSTNSMYCFQISPNIINKDQKSNNDSITKNANDHKMDVQSCSHGLQFSMSIASEQNNSQEIKQQDNMNYLNIKPWHFYQNENIAFKQNSNKGIKTSQQPNINTLNSKIVLISTDLSNRRNQFQNKPFSSIKVIPNIFIKLPPSNQNQNHF